jgi:hypothetical protein
MAVRRVWKRQHHAGFALPETAGDACPGDGGRRAGEHLISDSTGLFPGFRGESAGFGTTEGLAGHGIVGWRPTPRASFGFQAGRVGIFRNGAL